MPTFNQLVKQGRQKKTYKSKTPAMQTGFNTIKNKLIALSAPQKRGVCTRFPPPRRRSRTPLSVR